MCAAPACSVTLRRGRPRTARFFPEAFIFLMLREARSEGNLFPPGRFHSQVAPARGSEGRGVLGACWGRGLLGQTERGVGDQLRILELGLWYFVNSSLMTLWPDNNLSILTF